LAEGRPARPVRRDSDRHGLFASEDAKAKTAGVNINLWAGLVILAGGAIFLAWVVLRPLRAEDLQDTDTDRPRAE
jgi:hypothetical protein